MNTERKVRPSKSKAMLWKFSVLPADERSQLPLLLVPKVQKLGIRVLFEGVVAFSPSSIYKCR
jgi:hypothetical protein